MQDLTERVVPVIGAIVAAHPAQRVAIAMHGGPIRALVGHVLGMPLTHLSRLQVGYCSVTAIEYRPERPPRVLQTNVSTSSL